MDSQKMKVALSMIPVFDGKNMNVYDWLLHIERAQELVSDQLPLLLTYLRSKLTGEALNTTDKVNFQSLDQFKSHFEDLYSKKTDYNTLMGRLYNLYQFNNETVLSYKLRFSNLVERVKKLHQVKIANRENA